MHRPGRVISGLCGFYEFWFLGGLGVLRRACAFTPQFAGIALGACRRKVLRGRARRTVGGYGFCMEAYKILSLLVQVG